MNEGERHEVMVEALAENIQRVASEVCVGMQNSLPEVEENLDRPDRLMASVERIVSQNPRIRSCGISFIEGYYPQKGRAFMPYAFRGDSGRVEVSDLGTVRQDYLHEKWFLEGLQAKGGYWSEPFFEAVDSVAPLVAYLQPVRDAQGRTVAVLGVDLPLSGIHKDMAAMDGRIFASEWTSGGGRKRKQYKPYSFLISGKGTFLVHPDKQRIIRDNINNIIKASPDTLAAYAGRRMKAGESSAEDKNEDAYLETFEFDGADSYFFYRPIKQTDWSVALVVPELSIDMVGYIVGGVLVFFVLVAVLVVWLVSRLSIRRATMPLKLLASSADEVAKGNFDTPLPDIKYNDEFLQLRDSFEVMQHSLTLYIAELKDTTASKAAMEKELKVAHDIQMSMLPKIFPPYPERSDIDIYGMLTPAKDVGGDLFDFYIRDERLFFCIGDVSGKGVPASLVMATTHSLFRSISGHMSDPVRIAETLNNTLADGNETSMFVTAFIGVLDLATGCLRYCNAGHNPPLIIGREVSVLDCEPNVVLGLIPGLTFVQQEIHLDPQTSIFLFTDGLNEAEDATHAQFGDDRIRSVLEKLLKEDKNEPEMIVTQMCDAVHSYVNGAEQSDDLTMLAIKYKGGERKEERGEKDNGKQG